MAKLPAHQTPRAKEAPLVSVVTPVYNGGEYLVECIESVIGQSYQNWEYLLVDNASTDLTPEIISRFASKDSRIKHVRFEEHVGAIDNHNRALRASIPPVNSARYFRQMTGSTPSVSRRWSLRV